MGRILVVDDNVDTCKVLSAFLAHAGHTAICVTSVPAAMLKLIDPEVPLPDVVITDLMMPEQSGVDLVREIRAKKRTRAIPIIVYSAVSEQRFVEQAMNAGATDYWLKGSFRPDEMQARIAAFLPAGVDWVGQVRPNPVRAFS